MAKNHEGSNWIPVGVAVLSIGLFLGWLATREPPRSVEIAEPGDTAAAAAGAADTVSVAAGELEGPGAFDAMVGQTVSMESVNVVSWLNPRLFWIELAGGELYLVKMGDDLLSAGQTAPAPGLVDLVGVVRTKDDAVLDGWMQAGVLESDDQRVQAEFGQTYLEAQQVQAAGAGN